MSNYRHFKHFFNPADWLDSKWKDKINTGFLSVNDAATLSGFTSRICEVKFMHAKIQQNFDFAVFYIALLEFIKYNPLIFSQNFFEISSNGKS